MTGHEPDQTQRPNYSTGPKAPEGKSRCRLNAYRHGLTGQLCVFTPEEQQVYEKHCKIVHEGLAPVGDFERGARAIEASTFALGMHEHSIDNTGHVQVDDAFAQARTWRKDAHNLQLLTVYEQRIQRAMDKNLAQFKTRQTERKQAAAVAMKEAKLLYGLAKAQGKPYKPESYFITAPEVRESVFSTTEVARELGRARLLWDAGQYENRNLLPRENKPEQPVEAAAA
jgi:hypothetical protein